MEIVLLFLTFQKKVAAFTLTISKKKKIKDRFKVFVNCAAIKNCQNILNSLKKFVFIEFLQTQ